MNIRYAHPIDPEIRGRVLAELAAIEERHDVRVLMACESGSRGWGFSSPDSDYDVRFVYAHKLDWYLQVAPQRDVIELPISDELDISGWELRKFLQLLRSSNAVAFEWLGSPVRYREDVAFMAAMRVLAPAFFSEDKGRWHYLSMARKHFRNGLQGEQVKLKKYLYALRALLAVHWIDAGRGVPPMRFADMADVLLLDGALREALNRLLDSKMAAGEAEQSAPSPLIHAFLARDLAADLPGPQFARPDADARLLDKLLHDLVVAAHTSAVKE